MADLTVTNYKLMEGTKAGNKNELAAVPCTITSFNPRLYKVFLNLITLSN